MMDQQLVARIKRRSKYWGQTAPNQWFDVRVVEDTGYRLRGNNNNYRLDDVNIGVRLANGFIVDLANGKTRALADHIGSYPAASKKFWHCCGVKRSLMRPMAVHRPSTVRSAALRRWALSLEKAFSIGLKSGL